MTGRVGFAGIYPMLYAFFDRAGRLDRAAMRRQVEACVAAGAHGLAVLGLATEVGKLAPDERRAVLAWAAEELGGRLPLAVTVAEATAEGQIAFVRAAAEAGASWAILQPPRTPDVTEAELMRLFGGVADAAPIPIAIQNAPQYIGVGLSHEGLVALARAHPNLRLLKAEGSALQTAELIEATGRRLAVFNGRGGLEMTDCLRGGCAGMIPAPECADVHVRIFELMQSGRAEDEAEAERLYRDLLPLTVFLMQSVDQFICYGKRLTARRLGLGEVHDRAPAQRPTAFGLACLERHARALGPLA